ncbi:MAG TPA: DNA repair protein RecN [Nitrospirae bacterium]|nr:DNA repair protein RecN [Nitrospirota bacterium]
MLREIHIKNFSIIDNVHIEFGEGFNVLTGETGAGKSIIIDALSLALGERATGDFIRSGEKEAVVAAFFDVTPKVLDPSTRKFLDDNGIDIDDGLILKRIISAKGRSRAYINGSMVNVQNLSDVSRAIIDVHGQYEHQSLLSPEKQLDLLDIYGGLLKDRKEVEGLYENLHALKRNISGLEQKEKDRAQRLDMLDFQVNEIGAADLSPGEVEQLAEDEKILGSAVHLAELSNRAYESLYSSDASSISVISDILKDLKEIAEIDSRANEPVKSVKDALPLLEETGYFLRDYKDSLDFDPGRLEQVQERLELIKRLGKKYGGSVREILEFREKAVEELEGLRHSEEELGSMKEDLERSKAVLTKKAGQLSKKREKISKKIETEVIAQLNELSMPDTKFSVRITHESGDDTTDGLKARSSGIDRIEFLISPNVGEDLKPLSKIASGGELSRIMLALKVIMAKGDEMPVLVFDEIDAGIGGRTAETVGFKLKGLSSYHQVLCITHLPQIASFADVHLKIEKKAGKERTTVEIKRINKDERTEEIARMLGGKISKVSLKHAEEMLEKGRN